MKKIVKKYWKYVVCLVLCIGLLATDMMPALLSSLSELKGLKSQRDTVLDGTAMELVKVVDGDTMDRYREDLDLEDSSLYAGKVWADKSVFKSNIILDYGTDGYTGIIKNDSDFLHAFSALGSSQTWVGLPPTKTIIIIDNSGSMYSNNKTDWKLTRMDKTVNAVNTSIDQLMRAGAYNEVAVVLFGQNDKNGVKDDNYNTATVIVPMGHYPVSSNSEEPYKYLDAGWKSSSDVASDAPIKEASKANTSGGYVFVDKKYINDKFEIDDSVHATEGLDRYDRYSNGTTNINAGIYVAFDTLLKTEKSVTVAGITFNYIPSVVLLSDGAATDLLNGSWSNPILEARGYTNDRGNKKASYIQGFEDPADKYTYDWNMYIDLIEKDGVQTLEQIGYGDGSLQNGFKAEDRPGEVGTENLKNFADEVRSTQGAAILTTILNSSYMKQQVEMKFEGDCKFYTISVDMANPEDIKLPEEGEWFSGTGSYTLNTNAPVMNPNEYFNPEWLKRLGYVKKDADLNNLTKDDVVYEPYTVGYELVLAMIDAFNAYNEFKNNSDSYIYRNKLSKYVAYGELANLYNDMKDGTATISSGTYKATIPIGPNHSNAYIITARSNVSFDNLDPSDTENNPYGISNSDINYDYVTQAYYASTNDEVSDKIKDTFDIIISDIITRAFTPVRGSNDLGVTDSLTYMDPIGQYMEIKDVKSLLLFGTLYSIKKTAKYSYDFSENHKGENHDSSTGTFTPGWYRITTNPDGSEKVEYKESGVSWDDGYEYYVDADIAQQYVPTLINTDNLGSKQKHTEYTFYRFDLPNDPDGTKRNELRMNPCYGEDLPEGVTEANYKGYTGVYKLSDIRIWVEDTGNYIDDAMVEGGIESNLGYDEALYVDIPASALPLIVATVTLGRQEDVASYTTNMENKKQSTPLRLFYTVGVQDAILTQDKLNIDLTKISQEYIAKNKNVETGELYFYSNWYNKDKRYEGYVSEESYRTFGDPVLSFSLNGNNQHYIAQKEYPIYEAEGEVDHYYGGPVKLTSDGLMFDDQKLNPATEINSDKWYYLVIDYYTGDEDSGEMGYYALARKGAEFGSGIGSSDYGDYLCWYDRDTGEVKEYSAGKPEEEGTWIIALREGGVRSGDLGSVAESKEENVTGTAYNYYIPTISSNTHGLYNAVVNIYLGNNGRLAITDTLLTITKDINYYEENDILNPESPYFDFRVGVAGREGDIDAIRVIKNPYSGDWQRRISTIDVLTNNQGFLQDPNDALYVYEKGGKEYYVYIGDNTVSTGDEYAFRVYDAEDNDDGITLSRSGTTTYVENPDEIPASEKSELKKYKKVDQDHSLGMTEFWIKEVSLVSKEDYERGNIHKVSEKLNEFVVMTLEPAKTDESEISTSYATKTTFLTTTLYFGYTEENKPKTKPEEWPQEEWDNQKPYYAQVKLKGGEGILLNGIPENTKYVVEEKLNTDRSQEGWVFEEVKHVSQKETTIEEEEIVTGNTGKQQEEVHYQNTYLLKNLRVLKKMGTDEGARLEEVDYNQEFTFDISFKDLNGNPLKREISYEIYDIENNLVKEKQPITLEGTENEKFSFKLKGNEYIEIYGLPLDTGYMYSIVEEESQGFHPVEKEVTGTVSKKSDNVTPCIFTNMKERSYTEVKVTGLKTLLDGTLKDKEFTFEIIPSETNPEEDPIKGGKEVKNNADGEIVFIDERYTIAGVYEYTIREKIPSHSDDTVYDRREYLVTVEVLFDEETYTVSSQVDIKEIKEENEEEETEGEIEEEITEEETEDTEEEKTDSIVFENTRLPKSPIPNTRDSILNKIWIGIVGVLFVALGCIFIGKRKVKKS